MEYDISHTPSQAQTHSHFLQIPVYKLLTPFLSLSNYVLNHYAKIQNCEVIVVLKWWVLWVALKFLPRGISFPTSKFMRQFRLSWAQYISIIIVLVKNTPKIFRYQDFKANLSKSHDNTHQNLCLLFRSFQITPRQSEN